MMHFKTFFSEFSGETPEDVIRAVHADSRKGTGMSLEEWWKYQEDVWAKKYKIEVPAMNEPDSYTKLLEILIKVGALEKVES